MKHLLYFLAILILVPAACSKNSSEPENEDPYRYNYPNYGNASIKVFHSFYHDCGDSIYWRYVYRSKKFSVDDSLFLRLREPQGFNEETPNLTDKEEVILMCSNGDEETIVLNFSYPPCIYTVENINLRFGGVPTNKNVVTKNNGIIDVQQDSIQVIVHRKSYWTGKMVFDTAYVSP